jgi:hypothetical protein
MEDDLKKIKKLKTTSKKEGRRPTKKKKKKDDLKKPKKNPLHKEMEDDPRKNEKWKTT